jgi:Tol biopolymer transport system component
MLHKRRLFSIVVLLSLGIVTAGRLYFVLRQDQQIAFIASDHEQQGLVLMNLHNQQFKLINPHAQADFAWSPDGQQIAYVATSELDALIYHIFIMNADGTHIQQLTDGPTRDHSPTWSPDGQQIAFVSNRDSLEAWMAIFIMNRDGTDIRRITPIGYYHDLAWSPDGRRLSFIHQVGYQGNIHIMDVDGTHMTRLTDGRNDSSPAWSPDGAYIAFASYRGDPHQLDIYVVRSNGAEIRRLTGHPAHDRNPAWSPDGKQILFESNRDSEEWNYHIYLMNADGTEQRRLTELKGGWPTWRP